MQRDVTLPEGVSLDRVGQVLRDAWEVGSHQWTRTPLQLREGTPAPPPPPLPADALELFRLLHARQVSYLLVGGIALLTYIHGRNTKDVDLLLSAEALHQVRELEILDENNMFARARFRSLQVDVLLTTNPLFKIVAEGYATRHRFAELEVPVATVEGLVILKLFALPSLYRQFEMDRVALFESDIHILVARYSPQVMPLLELVERHVPPREVQELRQFATGCVERAQRLRSRFCTN